MATTILDALCNDQLFGKHFEGDSWRAWKVFLASLFGLPLPHDDLPTYWRATERETPPRTPFSEGYCVVGRRGGKSRIGALLATYLATFRDYSRILAPGEVGTVMVLSADRKQARTIFRYARGLIESVPMLKAMVVRETQETIELNNRVQLEIHTSNYRSVRGYTVLAAVLDEVAFWDDPDSANPDVEVVRALKPAMGTVKGSILLGVSTAYARRGLLWQKYDRHYGDDDSNVLIWRGSTLDMHPSFDRAIIDEAYNEDPSSAASEYDSIFRRDIESFLSEEAIDACVAPGQIELPPADGVRYFGFVDPSGGSRDSYAVAVAHIENDRVVVDALREHEPPFSPEGITEQYAKFLKSYHVARVTGDRYAGQWPREQFQKHGVEYRTSERNKSELYLELLPKMNAGRVVLPDHRRLRVQLARLERRTSRAGKDSVDHPPKGKDDLSNVVAGVVSVALARKTLNVAPISITQQNVFDLDGSGTGSIQPGEMDFGDRHPSVDEYYRQQEERRRGNGG